MTLSSRSLPAAASFLVLAGFSPLTQAVSLEMIWETPAEFSNPESVLHDAERDVLYVSNVNGVPNEKDGNGFISRLATDGSIIELEWVGGLNAPKGMAMSDGKLYVSDITALVEIDIESGEITNRFEQPASIFMNDVASDGDGNVYVSDMVDNKLYRLSDGDFAVWIDNAELENPNGLFVDGETMIVGSWGNMNDDFSTDVPGHLKSVSLSDGSVETLGSGAPVGNLDGVEAVGDGSYFVSDWVAGALYQITVEGESDTLLDLNQGSADIETLSDANLVIIPMMNDNKVVAYTYTE